MYELIAHQKLESTASTITFSNIPQIYTDLYLVVSARSTRTDQGPRSVLAVQFNGVTTGYSYRRLFGIPTLATGSDSGSGADSFLLGYQSSNATTANTFGNASLYIPNYTASQNKVGSSDSVGEGNESQVGLAIQANVWSNTAAITSLTIYDPSFNLVQNSSATLYGVNRTSALGRPKAIGGNITYANGYWVHTFTGSGTFTAQEDLSLEYLVVAGGGGGGNRSPSYASGGGAGGYRSSVIGELSGGGASREPVLSVKADTSYAVIVGAGGAAATQGSNSILGSIASFGGGRGISGTGTTGIVGGSGSGGGNGNGPGGAGIAGQGYAGGRGSDNTFSTSTGFGGGGGAGAIGGWSYGNAPGAGGAGLQSSITGSYTWRAAGGGGSADIGGARQNGIGGGTYGSGITTIDENGTVNTGSGGGGGQNNGYVGSGSGTGGTGGSGVVIIRYRAD